MSVSLWQADGTQAVQEVDFLIVGAGIVGCAAAVFAAQAGHSVLITEQADVGMGASGRNAGFMITGLDLYYHRAIAQYGAARARELWQLSQESIAFWKEVIAQADPPVGFAQIGSLLLAESEEEAQELALAAAAMEADGLPIHFYDHDPLKRGYYAAIEQAGDGAVQPYQLAQAVLARSGARLIANNPIYGIEQGAPDCVTVYSLRYIFRAQYVLLCTNAYSPLIDPFFVDKVIPTRAQILATEPLPAPVLETCGYSNYGYMYYRMSFDGRLLIGGGRHKHKALEHNTTEDRINAAVQGELEAYLRRYFPEVQAGIARRWAGIMGFSADGVPLVGTLPQRPRVGYAVGFTGHGLSMGAGTARRAVAHLLHGADAGALDARRLQAVG